MTKLGKYELIEEIGRGGFAVVYQARDASLDRLVALKVLHPYWAEDPDFVTRFRREARAAAGLRQPHIVTIYEASETAGQLYIAMTYLPGRSLRELLQAEGPLPLDRALPILAHMAEALDYAHAQGVIHRDVKPGNVIVEESASGLRATLLDFGLVKALEDNTALTSMGKLLGSPEYMAPEQADPNRVAEVGPAADRYALGIVAYHLLTGRVPFPGNTPGTLNAHEHKPVPAPRSLRPELPEAAAVAMLKMLAKAPAGRYPSATAFVSDLQNALRSQDRIRERSILPDVPRRMMSRWVWGIGIAGVVVLLGLFRYGARDLGARLLAKPTPPEMVAVSTATDIPPALTTDVPTAPPTLTPGPTATAQPAAPIPTGTPPPPPTPTPTHTLAPTASPTATPTLTPGPGATTVRPTDGMVLVYVPGGTFQMGSDENDPNATSDESPRHPVTLDSFWIDQTEVTNAHYARCVAAGVCRPSRYADDSTYNGEDYPVVGVSWDDAVDYCQWAGGRLPTEAEWEYAARGPEGRIYPWGDRSPDDTFLNYSQHVGRTTRVGSYPDGASWVGALDMAGNVWEWVNDWYDSDYYASSPPQNPTGPATGEFRVLRGGGWGNSGRNVRAADRSDTVPGIRDVIRGFRCVVSPGE